MAACGIAALCVGVLGRGEGPVCACISWAPDGTGRGIRYCFEGFEGDGELLGPGE
jgi:hypothetical protein